MELWVGGTSIPSIALAFRGTSDASDEDLDAFKVNGADASGEAAAAVKSEEGRLVIQ